MLEFFQAPPEVPGIEARIAVAVAFTAAAAYYDMFNKKWVPNALLYAFILSAIAVNIAFFEEKVFMQAVAFGAAAFAVSYPLYKMGQLGGADVYAYSGIALSIPYLPQPIFGPAQQIPYPFLFSALAPTGLAFIAHMLVRFVPYIAARLKSGEVRISAQKAAPAALISLAFLFFIYSLSSLPVALPAHYLAILGFLFSALVFFSLFKEEIKESMIEYLPLSKIQPEDVLAVEKMDQKAVLRLRLNPLLDQGAISRMKKAKLKKAPIFTKMPFFLPYLLFGLIISILFGDMVHFFLNSAL
ncbi:MAG: hypothetical protein N3F07_00865 [Candidatus Micrarchaeota archaeon]|nr:hypothetical protein [Candidatus Micrarchaeota archaeon]